MGKTANKKSGAPSPALVSDEENVKKEKTSPLSPKHKSDLVSYRIRLLDNAQASLNVSISKNDTGEKLFSVVCDELGDIVERDYFGLRFTDKNHTRQWLDLGRSVRKQLSASSSKALSLRVKHYPGDPISDFHQEISQYWLYLQIRRDLLQGRLLCPPEELYLLGGLIYQAELGDATEGLNGSTGDASSPERQHMPMQFQNAESPVTPDTSTKVTAESLKASGKPLKIVFNETDRITAEITKAHKNFCGLTARDAEIEILKRASKLPTYGVDPIPVKLIEKNKLASPKPVSVAGSMKSGEQADATSTKTSPAALGTEQPAHEEARPIPKPSGAVYLGLRHTGLTTYVGLKPSDEYHWDQISRLACDGKDFIVILKPEEVIPSDKKHKRAKPQTVIFRCETKAAALAAWKWTVDRKSFFTLKQASEAKKTKTTNNFFRRSHSYKFCGRSQTELKSITSSGDPLPQPPFERVSSMRRSQRSTETDSTQRHATLPARLRANAGDDVHQLPLSEPSKRADLGTVVEQSHADELDTSPQAVQKIMNISEDLVLPPAEDPETPIRAVCVSQVESYLPSESPVAADLQKTPEVEIRKRTAAVTSAPNRDSESSQALKEIDQAIESHQPNGQRSKNVERGNQNGEVVGSRTKTVNDAITKDLSNYNGVFFAETAALFLGITCFAVLIAILETHPRPGQTDAWSTIATHVREAPLISSFDSYVYSPVRQHLANGFSTVASWLGGK